MRPTFGSLARSHRRNRNIHASARFACSRGTYANKWRPVVQGKYTPKTIKQRLLVILNQRTCSRKSSTFQSRSDASTSPIAHHKCLHMLSLHFTCVIVQLFICCLLLFVLLTTYLLAYILWVFHLRTVTYLLISVDVCFSIILNYKSFIFTWNTQ